MKNDALLEVAHYYDSKLSLFGETPQGVDWNGEDSQKLRFQQLCKLIENCCNFEVNDLGCGYGALFDYLQQIPGNVTYYGYDVSESMIAAARSRLSRFGNAQFYVANRPQNHADFGFASGIFNVRLQQKDSAWEDYIIETLEFLNETSRKGFAFNCLSLYSDIEKRKDYLYYGDPGKWFDHCKRNFTRNVALLHDYNLYEFTMLVRKNL